MPDPSADIPDWTREAKAWFEWAPAKSLLASIRAYQRHASRRGPVNRVLRGVAVLRHRFWGVITGADIPINTQIGGGLMLPHPNGIVIHPAVVLGPNCLIFQQVTLGWSRDGVPRLAGHVDVGAGAKLIGPISVGPHVEIGANAVVTKDVPAHSVAMGIPARIVPKQSRS